MKTKIILLVVTLLILAIALTTASSNMGFKLSQTLDASITKYVSIPYYNSYGTQTAQLLRNDIYLACGSTGTLHTYTWNGSAWQRYSGGGVGQVNFALTPGIGYQVFSSVGTTNWVVVGSHNPATTIPLVASVTKYVSVPYHTTATTAQLLRNEIYLACRSTGTLHVYNWNGSAWQRYSGGGVGQVNFAITPGIAYQVFSSVGAAGWVPNHY